MSTTNTSSDAGINCGGWGCWSLILTILVLWALFVGLPTPWGEFHIDLIPPAIRLEK